MGAFVPDRAGAAGVVGMAASRSTAGVAVRPFQKPTKKLA
jgi:hypothetical protein